MSNDIRLYLRYLAISIRGQMQYRVSFLLQTLGMLMITAAEFLGITFLFQRFGSLRGWSLPEVALLYGMVNIAFALAEGIGRGFDIFPRMVRTGEFDRMLLRPRSTLLQVAGLEAQLMRLGRLLQATVVLGWAAATLHIAVSPERIALLLASILGGCCLFYGLFVLQATLSFWTIETLEIMNTVTYGGTETGQYPLTIYRPWFRVLFTFVVPIASMNYLPAAVLLPTGSRLGVPAALPWLSPLIGATFLLLSFRIWRVGVRRYASTGS